MKKNTIGIINSTIRLTSSIALFIILALSITLSPARAQTPAGWSFYTTDNGKVGAIFPCRPFSSNQDLPVPQGMIRMQHIIGQGEQGCFTVTHQALPNGTNGVAHSQYLDQMISYQANDQQALILEHYDFMLGQMHAKETVWRNSEGVYSRIVTVITPSGYDLYQFGCAAFTMDYAGGSEARAFFASAQMR